MRTADRAVRFVNPTTGECLIVYPIESPETCPHCHERRCVFLAQPNPVCLACATPTGRIVVDAGGGALVGVTWNDRVEREMRGGRA